MTSSRKEIREGPLEERCISKPPDFGRACLGSSGFHESTTQGHPSTDGGLPPRGRLRYYIVESGQESMAEFNQMFPPSLFGMETTARRKQHVQEIYSGTKNQLGTKTNMLNVPSAKSQGTILGRRKKLQLQHQHLKEHQQGNRHRDPPESPLQPLRAREEHARPVESSMRILSFGLQVLLNLLIPLVLSLAKILPLRILGS
ncbi:hypothetical protein YC2023_010520 [Brassica napus]